MSVTIATPTTHSGSRTYTCRQVWGGDCDHVVTGPTYTHGLHWETELAPDCPVRVLAELSRHEDPAVRWEVARHQRTPLPALRALARDGNLMVAMEAGQHPCMQGAFTFTFG